MKFKCKEVFLSIIAGLDRRQMRAVLSSYFDADKKRILREAYRSPWITDEDIKLIANPKFDTSQMREIMRSCQELTNEQVRQIANHEISAAEMHSFRLKNRIFERH